jgi:hypothetical protein
MKRLLVVLALCILAVPAFADAPTEIAGSLDWQKGDETGRTWSAQFDLAFPAIGDLVGLGPVLRATYYSADVNPDPNDTGSLTLYEIGGQLVIWTTPSHNGFHFGVEATYEGSDVEGYAWAPFVGVEFGGDMFFARGRYAQLYHEANGETTDLERSVATFGFGWRL